MRYLGSLFAAQKNQSAAFSSGKMTPFTFTSILPILYFDIDVVITGKLDIFTKAKNFAITKQAIKPEGHTVGRIVSVGMASLIVQLSIVIIIAVNNNLLTKYGYHTYASTGEAFGAVIPLAVVGIVMKVFGIVVSIVIGISLGGQPIIGYNMGAGNTERVKKTIQLITKLVLLVGMVAFLIFELAPDAIIYSEAIILRNIWSMRDCVSGFSWEESS